MPNYARKLAMLGSDKILPEIILLRGSRPEAVGRHVPSTSTLPVALKHLESTTPIKSNSIERFTIFNIHF